MSSFCTHIFFSKKIQHIWVSLDVNFNESLTNDIVSFEQLGPEQESVGSIFLPPSQKIDILSNICNIFMTKLKLKGMNYYLC